MHFILKQDIYIYIKSYHGTNYITQVASMQGVLIWVFPGKVSHGPSLRVKFTSGLGFLFDLSSRALETNTFQCNGSKAHSELLLFFHEYLSAFCPVISWCSRSCDAILKNPPLIARVSSGIMWVLYIGGFPFSIPFI
jgi:hypothetical protein